MDPGTAGVSRGARASVAGLLSLLGLLTALAPMSTDMYLPAFSAIAEAMGKPVAWVEATLAVYFVGAALGQLAFGPLSDRYGRRPPLLAGLLLFTLASAGCAMAPGIEWLLALRFLQALGASAGTVIARAVVTDCFDALGSARALSRMMLVMGVAPILAPLAGGQLLRLNWSAVFWGLVFFGAVCLALSHLALKETHPPAMRHRQSWRQRRRDMAELLHDVVFLRMTLAGALSLAAMFAYIAGSPFVFMERFGVAPEAYGWLFGSNAMGLVMASQLNVRLLIHRGPEQLLRWALQTLAVCTLALLGLVYLDVPGLGWLLPPIFLSVACVGMAAPNAAALALAGHRDRAGLAAALLGGLQFLVFGLATLMVSLWHDGTALPMAGTMVVCALAAVVTQRALRVA